MTDSTKSICDQCFNRRSLLRAGAAGALLAALPAAGCMQAESPPSGPVAAGNVADTTVGTLKVVAGKNVLLGRDAVGLYAMSQVCTHQGALVNIVSPSGAAASGVRCPLHGSAFDENGAVTAGPAGSPLEHFAVELATDGSGDLTIQGGQIVTSDVRTPVA